MRNENLDNSYIDIETELQQIVESKEMIIYGAGVVAECILPYIINDVKILAVTVTYPSIENDTLCGIPIMPIEFLLKYRETATVLIATYDTHHKEITERLVNFGFNKIIQMTLSLRCAFFNNYCIKFLKKHGVDIDNETIQIGDINLLNPKFLPERFADKIYSQINILLLHLITNRHVVSSEGLYEYEQSYINDNETVFDCGANMGVFSAYAASKGGKVYAFEPTEELLPIIKRHSEINNHRIIAVQSALSNYTGQVEFAEKENCGENSIVNINNTINKRTVECITLDDFVYKEKIKQVGFIKADIEGAERLMLEGAHNTLKYHAPKLTICTYHLPDDKKVIEEIILAANSSYKIVHHWKKLFAWV